MVCGPIHNKINMLRVLCLLVFVTSVLAVPRNTLRNMHDGRIVNGTDAPPGKYPSQVSFEAYGAHSCGASILNENWILTAAHCVYYKNPSSVEIISGTVNLNTGGTRHQVIELIQHDDYNPNNIENDIAVVRVDPPFVFDSMTQPVVLPAQNQETPGGSNATVIGWGYPYTGGDIMKNLQEVDYWIVDDQECMDIHNYVVFPTNICAYYPGGGKGQCSGDSGGPLFVNGQQVGIVSWSEKPCTIAPYPGVFTEVSPYIIWINSKIN